MRDVTDRRPDYLVADEPVDEQQLVCDLHTHQHARVTAGFARYDEGAAFDRHNHVFRQEIAALTPRAIAALSALRQDLSGLDNRVIAWPWHPKVREAERDPQQELRCTINHKQGYRRGDPAWYRATGAANRCLPAAACRTARDSCARRRSRNRPMGSRGGNGLGQ
jgi:hypothetical protein